MISGLQLKKTSVSLQEVQDLKDKVEAAKLPRDRSILLLITACLIATMYAMCWLVFYDKFLIEWLTDNFNFWTGGLLFTGVNSVNLVLIIGFSFLWYGPVKSKVNRQYIHNKKLKEDLLRRVSALQDLVALQESLLLALGDTKNEHAYLSADYIYFAEKVDSVYVITEEFNLPEGIVTEDDPGVLNISIANDDYYAIQEDFKALNQQRR